MPDLIRQASGVLTRRIMNRAITVLLAVLTAAGCERHNNANISIDPLRRYATTYEPCSGEGDCYTFFRLPDIPADVQTVLEKRIMDEQFIIYNSLIMLKLYRTQIERAHQSYDIRNETTIKHPVLAAFGRYSGMNLSGEFVSSSISYDWVVEQREYRRDIAIAEEIRRIEIELDNIDRQIYWK